LFIIVFWFVSVLFILVSLFFFDIEKHLHQNLNIIIYEKNKFIHSCYKSNIENF